MVEDTTKATPNLLLKRQEDQELRIYFFIGERIVSPFAPLMPQARKAQAQKQIFYVVAFKLEEAFETAKIKGQGFNLFYTAQNPTVREFLHELELESLAYQALQERPVKPKVEEKKPEEIKKVEPAEIKLTLASLDFEKFRAGLLFCANEADIIYQNPEDREILKKIISGLGYAK